MSHCNGAVVLMSLVTLFLTQTTFSQNDRTNSELNRIDAVEITYETGDQLILLTLSALDDNPFYMYHGEYFFENDESGMDEECFAEKLVFTDGVTTFTPQYHGYCYSYVTNLVGVELDSRDFLAFIQIGFADTHDQAPTLFMYTTDTASEYGFLIEAISADNALNCTYYIDNYGFEHNGVKFVEEDILLFHFSTFINVSTLNLTAIEFSNTRFSYFSFEQTPQNTYSLTGGEVLTQPVDGLAINVAIRLTVTDRLFLEDNDICTSRTNCRIHWSKNLVMSYHGYSILDNHNGVSIYQGWRGIEGKSEVICDPQPVYLELEIDFIGFSVNFTLRHGHPYHVDTLNEQIIRVSCYADGVNHTNPQLFLNNEPVDAQYLETSSPSEVTLFVNNGILDEGLLGYYTCRTQNNTFTTSSILHYEHNYIYLYEGVTYSVDYNDSIVVRFAHNNLRDYINDNHNRSIFYLIVRTKSFEAPQFDYVVRFGMTPYTSEVYINNIQFSHAGEYRIYDIGKRQYGAFIIVVNTPKLSVSPSVVAVQPSDSSVTLTCSTDLPTFGTAWQLPGEGSVLDVVHESTYELSFNQDDFEDLEGTELECVTFDPDRPDNIIARAGTVFREVDRPLTLITVNESAYYLVHNNGDNVKSTYYKCIGHVLTEGAMDLYWSIYDSERKINTDIYDDLEDELFLATVRGNLLTLSILGNFKGSVSCRSQNSSKNELQISVNAQTGESGSTYIVTTQPTSTTTTDESEEVQDQSIRVTLEGHTLKTFTDEVQLTFRQATATAINNYCETNDCPVSMRSNKKRRQSSSLMTTADDVVITDIDSTGTNAVQFSMYIRSQDGVLNRNSLVMAVEDSVEEFAAIGFVVSAELIVTPSPSRTPILTTGEIIGVAVGGAVFVILVTTLLLIFSVCLWYNCVSRKSYEKPSQKFAEHTADNPAFSDSEVEKAKDGGSGGQEEEKADLSKPETS